MESANLSPTPRIVGDTETGNGSMSGEPEIHDLDAKPIVDEDMESPDSPLQDVGELSGQLQALARQMAAMQTEIRRLKGEKTSVKDPPQHQEIHRPERQSDQTPSSNNVPSPQQDKPQRRGTMDTEVEPELVSMAVEQERLRLEKDRWDLERARREVLELQQRRAAEEEARSRHEREMRYEAELNAMRAEENAIRAAPGKHFLTRDIRASRKARESRRRMELINYEDRRKEMKRAEDMARYEALAAALAERGDLEPDFGIYQGPRRVIAGISQVSWRDFRLLGRQLATKAEELRDWYAIDVLRGEPRLQTGLGDGGDSTRDNIRPGPSLSAYSPADTPLPERIRVSSAIILDFLFREDTVPRFVLPPSWDQPRVFLRPFRLLAHYGSSIRSAWHEYTETLGPDKETDPDFKHIETLIKFMDQFLQKKIDFLASPECQKVSFSDVWHLFKPGDFVLSQDGSQAYQILSIASTEHRAAIPWHDFSRFRNSSELDVAETLIWILCVHIDFDGFRLGPVSTEFTIKRYEGEKAIESLEIYPANFHRDTARRDHFIARGKRFLQAAAVQHLHYSGFTLETMDEVDSQVVVDFAETFAAPGCEEWKPRIETLGGTSAFIPVFEMCEASCCADDLIFHDDHVEQQRDEAFMNTLVPPAWSHSKLPSVAIYPRTLLEAESEENRVTDGELLIMSNRVFGFVLSTRKWAKLDLELLKPVGSVKSQDGLTRGRFGSGLEQEAGASLDQLVLPRGHKEMVLSLVAQHFRNKEVAGGVRDQFDIIRGKGKGLILLLHGAPGVGKTSTAECIAELFRKPLFHITCGDLGTTAKEVEASLETNFALANKWECILLIDEADIFLARRMSNDFTRNGLVAVFLRVLEYYAGILFLTTNRVGEFDEAFTSRIHISLHYPTLDEGSTEAVFCVNLERIRKWFHDKERSVKIDETRILLFARMYWRDHPKARWNGRQIRNACQTALALAESENHGVLSPSFTGPASQEKGERSKADVPVSLGVGHFETVANAYLNFMGYLHDIYGTDPETRAKENFLRALDKSDTSALANLNAFSTSSRWKGKEWDYRAGPAQSAAPFNAYNLGAIGSLSREEMTQQSLEAANLQSMYSAGLTAVPPMLSVVSGETSRLPMGNMANMASRMPHGFEPIPHHQDRPSEEQSVFRGQGTVFPGNQSGSGSHANSAGRTNAGM